MTLTATFPPTLLRTLLCPHPHLCSSPHLSPCAAHCHLPSFLSRKSLLFHPERLLTCFRLNDDILHMILRCSDFEELVSAAQASKSLRAKTCNVLDVRLNHMLNRFFTDPKQLRVLLTETDSVISGSFALELIAARATWTCNDLDIYATSAGVDILSSFCEKQGYVTVRPATTANNEAANDEPVTDNDDYASTLATNLGISQIIKFSNGSRKIDLIISNTDCSIYPITYFWNTTLFNFISGSTICSAYPRHIFQHHGQLLPRRAREYRIPRLQEKYEKRGFTFQKCTANEPGYDAGLRRPTRVFGDRLCLITSTTGDCDSGEKQLRARYVLNNLLWSE